MDATRDADPAPDGKRPEMAQPGARVMVRRDYALAGLRGVIGTVEQEYVHFACRILGVRLGDGRYELFWQHEIEAAE